MRHRVQGSALGRDTKQRKALFKTMLTSLFEHGAVETTETKAKAVRRLAEKIITKGKPRTINARRILERFFGRRQIVNHIVDSVVPATGDRTSGFTRITHLGTRRGDDASMVKLELVDKPLVREVEAAEETVKKVATVAKTEVKKAEKAVAKKVTKTAKK